MPRYRDKNYDELLDMTDQVRNVVAVQNGHQLEVVEKGPEDIFRRWKCRRCGATLEARLDEAVELQHGMTDFDGADLVEQRGTEQVRLTMCFGNVNQVCKNPKPMEFEW